MKPDLQNSFVADMQKSQITVRREFDAPKDMVWECYTKSDLLDRWFAPEPFTAQTKSMDFRPGGHWLFAMVSPDGDKHWSRFDYETIDPKDGFTAQDAFSDEDGNINRDMPVSTWEVTFDDRSSRTLVQIVTTYDSPEAVDQVVQMGMEEGIKATLTQLERLLKTMS